MAETSIIDFGFHTHAGTRAHGEVGREREYEILPLTQASSQNQGLHTASISEMVHWFRDVRVWLKGRGRSDPGSQ